MASLDKLFPYVQPYVPECPEVVIETHLAEALATFCMETYVWRVDVEDDVTSSGESLYELDIPAGSVLEDVLVFEINGNAAQRVSDRYVSPQYLQDLGTPLAYAIYQDKYVRLYPSPDGTYTFRGTVVLKPSLSSKNIEDFIYETHGRDIAYGAIAKLTAIPGKAWTDYGMSVMYSQMFGKCVADARVRDYRSVPLRVRAQTF